MANGNARPCTRSPAGSTARPARCAAAPARPRLRYTSSSRSTASAWSRVSPIHCPLLRQCVMFMCSVCGRTIGAGDARQSVCIGAGRRGDAGAQVDRPQARHSAARCSAPSALPTKPSHAPPARPPARPPHPHLLAPAVRVGGGVRARLDPRPALAHQLGVQRERVIQRHVALGQQDEAVGCDVGGERRGRWAGGRVSRRVPGRTHGRSV